MARVDRDFLARPAWEQSWMVENTWCDVCGEADLGLDSPSEYADDGRVYVEGVCRRCGGAVCSEIVAQNE